MPNIVKNASLAEPPAPPFGGKFLLATCQFIARCPYRLAYHIGALLGVLALFDSRFRHQLKKNLATAGYQQSYRSAVRHSGRALIDIIWIWFNPVARVMAHAKVIGWHHVAAALEKGGVIILTPHIGAFELIPRIFVHHGIVFTALFRAAHKPLLQYLIEEGRAMDLMHQVPAEGSGVRQLLRILKDKGATGILPDQVPKAGLGVLAPFFGRDAYTTPLPAKLAQSSNAQIILAVTQRDRHGFTCTFIPDTFGIGKADTPEAQAARINQAMEYVISFAPAQYNWSYKRYKTP